MPLYVVRWPDFTASLVSAADENDLVERLDQAGDPGSCTWTVYDGDVWLDFIRDRLSVLPGAVLAPKQLL
jgi:hypothetical protein